MANLKKKNEEEKQQIQSLSNSKATLEKEIQEISREKQHFIQELKTLKQALFKVLQDEKRDPAVLLAKLDRYQSKLAGYNSTKTKMDETRRVGELNHSFIHSS